MKLEPAAAREQVEISRGIRRVIDAIHPTVQLPVLAIAAAVGAHRCLVAAYTSHRSKRESDRGAFALRVERIDKQLLQRAQVALGKRDPGARGASPVIAKLQFFGTKRRTVRRDKYDYEQVRAQS